MFERSKEMTLVEVLKKFMDADEETKVAIENLLKEHLSQSEQQEKPSDSQRETP